LTGPTRYGNLAGPWPDKRQGLDALDTRSALSFVLSVSVFMMMVCVGLSLSIEHFRALTRQSKPLWVGLGCQLLVAPACGFAVAWLYRDRPDIALGLVLLVAAPGGAVANGIVQFARARVDVSVALTTLNGLLCMVLTPVIVALGFAMFSDRADALQLQPWRTVQKIVLLVVLPVALGMLLRARLRADSNLVQLAHGGAAALVVVILAVVFVSIFDHLAARWLDNLPAALLLCALMLGSSHAAAAVAGLDSPLRFTISIEASIHNVPIVVLMADQLLNRPELAGLAVVYVPVIAVLALSWAFARRYVPASRGTGAPFHL
jgi:BASS family bile acid:Na+ symporter